MTLALCLLFVPWCDKVHHQLLAKGALLIKDAQALDSVAYPNFTSELVALQKRL